MKTASSTNSGILNSRRLLRRLLNELKKHPFKFLPERSVECLDQFFSGYQTLGPKLGWELDGFEEWLKKHLYYPNDSETKWWRIIKLHAWDKFHSYEMFFQLYDKYCREKVTDRQRAGLKMEKPAQKFDLYLWLHVISQRPGMYLGSEWSVHSIAGWLGGFFKGKSDAGLKLTRDETEFLRFEKWLCRKSKFNRQYPWYRVVEMWPQIGSNSLDSFFAYYDAYQTNYGKAPFGLEDLFESVTEDGHKITRRRRVLPSSVIRTAKPKDWLKVPLSKP